MEALTRRETEVAELIAWGLSKKDVANHLFLSQRTVENHARNIYQKTGCGKVNELSAWWFCTRFNISFELSPLRRKVIAGIILLMLLPQIAFHPGDILIRPPAARTARNSRRQETDPFEL